MKNCGLWHPLCIHAWCSCIDFSIGIRSLQFNAKVQLYQYKELISTIFCVYVCWMWRVWEEEYKGLLKIHDVDIVCVCGSLDFAVHWWSSFHHLSWDAFLLLGNHTNSCCSLWSIGLMMFNQTLPVVSVDSQSCQKSSISYPSGSASHLCL